MNGLATLIAHREYEERTTKNQGIKECLEKGKSLGLKHIEDWPKCVETRFSDIYNGLDCRNFLDLVEKHYNLNYTLPEVKRELENQNHSGASYKMVKSMVEHFYPSILEIFE